MPMFSLLGANHCLPLFHMDKMFIWINGEIKPINEFTLGYMIIPGLIFNKSFRKQVENVCILHFVKSHNLLLNPH